MDGDPTTMEAAHETAQQLREGELMDMSEKVRTMWQWERPWGCDSGKETNKQANDNRNIQ